MRSLAEVLVHGSRHIPRWMISPIEIKDEEGSINNRAGSYLIRNDATIDKRRLLCANWSLSLSRCARETLHWSLVGQGSCVKIVNAPGRESA